MTKAFNELYEELRKQVVDETVRRLQEKWKDDDWRDSKEFTSDEVISVKVEIEDELIRELKGDIEYYFDEDTSDTFTEIQEMIEEDGFVITEDE